MVDVGDIRAYGVLMTEGAPSDRHKLLRVLVTVGKERWRRLGQVAGETRRSEVIRSLIDWYLREPGAKLPERPPRQD